jgi:nicotinamidase-related amidase
MIRSDAPPAAWGLSALIVVDPQVAFDDPQWGPRNNPEADSNIAALARSFSSAGRPIVLVRHDSVNPDSPLHPSSPGHRFRPGLDGITPALLVSKAVNSSFHGTPDLDAWLTHAGLRTLFISGITTNHCCETTARVGGNLGYDVRFVLDATFTFDRVGPDGTTMTADELARATATNLHKEFATIVDTSWVLTSIAEGARAG